MASQVRRIGRAASLYDSPDEMEKRIPPPALILLVVAASPAFATDFCQRQAFDPEVPAGLEGRYEIVGRDPVTGGAYSGHLVVTSGESAYGLERVVDGNVSKGRAWIERCGPDGIPFLVAEYATQPVMKAGCRLGADGDNYYRATCRTDAGGDSWRGLEAWFQNHDPAW